MGSSEWWGTWIHYSQQNNNSQRPHSSDPFSPTLSFGLSSVQFSHSVVSDSLRPRELQHARPPCPSPTPRSSPKLTSIESAMPSSHVILCCPLLLLPSIPPSIRVFSNESTLWMRWPKYWSFSYSIIPSREHPGLISGEEYDNVFSDEYVRRAEKIFSAFMNKFTESGDSSFEVEATVFWPPDVMS